MAKNYALIRQAKDLKSQRDTLIQSIAKAEKEGSITFLGHYQKKLEAIDRSLADNMTKQQRR